MTKQRTRKTGLVLLLLVWLAVAFYGYQQVNDEQTTLKTITLGYQKADPFDIARQRGVLAKKMKAKGYKIVWKQFQDGAAELQALKSGSIDYARIGDTPPVVNLAAGASFVYIAAGSTKAAGSGILVKKNSTIKSIKDLKGKRVAYTKGTSSNYLILSALKKAGMSASDIKWVNLDNAAASVAFNKGKVDAWATWDPMTSTAELTQNAKLLVTGENGVSSNRDYVLSTASFAKNNEEVSALLVKYLSADMTWANKHSTQLVKMLSDSLNLSTKIVKRMVARRSFSMTAINQTVIKEEQDIADLFYEAGLIKKKLTIKDAVAYTSD
ncbi:aliphatic sulfonate ABC transporter substrate-binding protein [Lapidilactobacillus bayanensis]|uniref:aliphatic sulfonate ABC transporter substrate-binding protein n=1 Tax=Lapidilactobacillus bayanensis TaxID=2485998 RepID=UPI000F76DEE8|nr:aliphatic sulfonate ABC transporter substrate-binding protein [Lapidilactobacillus bayanensis]